MGETRGVPSRKGCRSSLDFAISINLFSISSTPLLNSSLGGLFCVVKNLCKAEYDLSIGWQSVSVIQLRSGVVVLVTYE